MFSANKLGQQRVKTDVFELYCHKGKGEEKMISSKAIVLAVLIALFVALVAVDGRRKVKKNKNKEK